MTEWNTNNNLFINEGSIRNTKTKFENSFADVTENMDSAKNVHLIK